jgi:hypothetical protein
MATGGEGRARMERRESACAMAVAGRCNFPGNVRKWRRHGILTGLVIGGFGAGLIYGVVDQFFLSD